MFAFFLLCGLVYMHNVRGRLSFVCKCISCGTQQDRSAHPLLVENGQTALERISEIERSIVLSKGGIRYFVIHCDLPLVWVVRV